MAVAHTHEQQADSTVASGAALELVWGAVATSLAIVGIYGIHPLTVSAYAAVAMAFSLLAHSGELAAKAPERDVQSAEEVGINLIAALLVFSLGGLSLYGIAPGITTPLALLVLAALLVLDAPLERKLAAPRGSLAGAYMVLAGLSAIVVLSAALSATPQMLVPWAVLLVSSAQVLGAIAVLYRYVRER